MGVIIRITGGATIVFFFFFYVGAQFIGGGKTIFAMFGLSLDWHDFKCYSHSSVHTIYGGFKSVIYTDCVQSLLMISALCIAPLVGLYYISKAPDVFASGIFEAMIKAAEPRYTSLFGGFSGWRAIVFVVSEASWLFGFLGGLPQLNVRFMAIKDERESVLVETLGILWTLLAILERL